MTLSTSSLPIGFTRGAHVTAGDTTLFVAEAGNPQGEPVVLLHGGLGSREDFLPLLPHLAADYRLIAIDSRGHGRSALGDVPALSYQQLEQDCALVLTELGLGAAVILGHSDGGIVALRLAAAGQIQPRGLVVVGAHGQLPQDDAVRDLYRGISAADWREQFAEPVARYEAENPAPDFARLFAATQAMWLGSGPSAYPGDMLRTVACPLLVVHGDDDFLVTRAHTLALVEAVPGARWLNLPFASHTVLEDDPAAVVPAVREFLGQLAQVRRDSLL